MQHLYWHAEHAGTLTVLESASNVFLPGSPGHGTRSRIHTGIQGGGEDIITTVSPLPSTAAAAAVASAIGCGGSG